MPTTKKRTASKKEATTATTEKLPKTLEGKTVVVTGKLKSGSRGR